jgi:hypothetical protein
MAVINKIPKAGSKGFGMAVTPDRDHLDVAITANGQCKPKDCWHRVAIASILSAWGATSRELASIKVDAGHIKLQFGGWRYTADTPSHVKRSLMLFDSRHYSDLRIREYNLRFRRARKIQTASLERKKKVRLNNRAWRKNNPDYMPPPASLRSRIEGHSSIV